MIFQEAGGCNITENGTGFFEGFRIWAINTSPHALRISVWHIAWRDIVLSGSVSKWIFSIPKPAGRRLSQGVTHPVCRVQVLWLFDPDSDWEQPNRFLVFLTKAIGVMHYAFSEILFGKSALFGAATP